MYTGLEPNEDRPESEDPELKPLRAPRRAYLDSLKNYETTTDWGKDGDKRNRRWQAQRTRYGFDDRQTWSLDYAMTELLYERLQMFLQFSDPVIDLDHHKFSFEDHEYTQREAIKELIRMGKKILQESEEDLSPRFWLLWATVSPAMWW